MQGLLTKFPSNNTFGWDAGVVDGRRTIVAAPNVKTHRPNLEAPARWGNVGRDHD
jgi:hypothetical protein